MYIHTCIYVYILHTHTPTHYIHTHKAAAPDAIIDGANVGFYSLRPDQGHTLSYSQVIRDTLDTH